MRYIDAISTPGGNMQHCLRYFVVISAMVIGFSAPDTVAQSTGPAAEAEPRLFAVEITIGPNWDTSKAPGEQVYFKEHSVNLKRLRDEGHIVMGARYSDKGLIIVSARSSEEVRTMMDQDPSITAGTFVYEVYAFNVFYPGLSVTS
jgi:hypothetical protein